MTKEEYREWVLQNSVPIDELEPGELAAALFGTPAQQRAELELRWAFDVEIERVPMQLRPVRR